MSNYEERLLQELRGLVAERPNGHEQRSGRIRRPRLALAGGFAAAVAIAASVGVFALSTGTQAAYAVTKNADGTVTVEIDSLTDAAGLQAKLQQVGVNAVVQYLPEGTMCAQPWFTPAGTRGPRSSSVQRVGEDGSIRFTIDQAVPAGETLVISTQTGADGLTALGLGLAQGDVPACRVVAAPAGSGPLGVATQNG